MANSATSVDFEITASDKASPTFERIRGSLDTLTNSYTRLIGMIGGGSLAVFAALTKSAIDSAGALYDMAQATGVSAQALSAMELSAKLAGVELQQVATGSQKLARNMLEAAQGQGAAAAAFKGLGIDVRDSNGQLKAIDQTMLETARALASMRNETQQVAYAQEIFGKSGAQLLPFLKELAESGLNNARVTNEMAAMADKFGDNLVKLQDSAKKFGFTLAEAVLPTLVKITEMMTKPTEQADMGWLDKLFLRSAATMAEWGETAERNIARLMRLAGADKLAAEHEKQADAAGASAARLRGRMQNAGIPMDMGDGTQFDLTGRNAPAIRTAEELAAAKRAADERRRMLEEGLKSEQASLAAAYEEREERAREAGQVQLRQWREQNKAYEESLDRDRQAYATWIDERLAQSAAAAEQEGQIRLKEWHAARKTEEDARNQSIKDEMDAQRARQQEWNRLWSTVEGTGKQVFTLLLSQGKNSFEAIGKALKASVIDLLYQMTARKWIIEIGAGMSGAMGSGVASAAGSAMGAGGMGGGVMSGLGGMLGSGLGAAGAWLGNGIVPGAAGIGEAFSTLGANALAGYEMAGGGMAGIMGGGSAALSAMGPVGWTMLAVAALSATGAGQKLGLGKLPIVGGLFGGKGPDSAIARGSDLQLVSAMGEDGQLHFSMGTMANYGAKAATENPLYRQLVNSFEDSSIWDKSKLQGLVGTRLTGDYEGGSAALVPKMLESIRGALIPGANNPFLDDATRAAEQAKEQQKAQEAAQQAAIAASRRQLEVTLMEAQGRAQDALNERRAMELESLDATLRPLQQQIYAAQDAAKAAEEAKRAEEDLARAREDQTRQLADLQAREASAVSGIAGMVRSLPGQLGIDALQGAITGLGTSDYLAPMDRLGNARGDFDRLLAASRGGDMSAISALPGSVQTLLGVGRDVFASGPEFQSLFREANSALGEILRRQQEEQRSILASVPLAIQQSANDTIAELKRGFDAQVEQLEALRTEIRSLQF